MMRRTPQSRRAKARRYGLDKAPRNRPSRQDCDDQAALLSGAAAVAVM